MPRPYGASHLPNQVLIIDQGTLLDRIDFNIETAADRIAAGTKELKDADVYQKRSRKMWCIYLLALLCGVLGAVLVLKQSMQ